MSEVRGHDQEEIPHAPKPEARGSTREEIPHAPTPEARVAAGRSNPTPKARGSSWEDQPHIQGAMAARAQEVLEELFHVEGQEGWR